MASTPARASRDALRRRSRDAIRASRSPHPMDPLTADEIIESPNILLGGRRHVRERSSRTSSWRAHKADVLGFRGGRHPPDDGLLPRTESYSRPSTSRRGRSAAVLIRQARVSSPDDHRVVYFSSCSRIAFLNALALRACVRGHCIMSSHAADAGRSAPRRRAGSSRRRCTTRCASSPVARRSGRQAITTRHRRSSTDRTASCRSRTNHNSTAIARALLPTALAEADPQPSRSEPTSVRGTSSSAKWRFLPLRAPSGRWVSRSLRGRQ